MRTPAAPGPATHGPGRMPVTRILGWTVFALVVVLVPFFIADTYSATILGNHYNVGLGNLSHAVALMVALLGLNIVSGYSGQLSLGHSFFVGAGAYITAVLVADFHWSYAATLGVIVPALFLGGVLLGIPALRIQGLYLGLLTFTLAALFPLLVRLTEFSHRTGGSNGKRVDSKLLPPDWAPLDPVAETLHSIPGLGGRVPDGLTSRQGEAVYKYFLLVIIALVCFWLARNLLASRVGRALQAIRDNPLGASASGVNLPAYKTLSFGISAALGGVAGTMLTMRSGFVGPEEFGFNLAILLIVGLFVGGVGKLGGAVVGGLLVQFVPDWASDTQNLPGTDIALEGPYGAVVLGALLILVTFAMPGGVIHGLDRFRRLLGGMVRPSSGGPQG